MAAMRPFFSLLHVILQKPPKKVHADSTFTGVVGVQSAGEPSASSRSLKTALFSLGLSHWKRV